LSNIDTNLGQLNTEMIIMRLYIAGEAPNSQRAMNRLQSLCAEYLKAEQYRIEIVDILEDPLRALSDRILVTPTLLKLAPPPTSQIIGDLSDTAYVLLALGIPEKHHNG
jgi:circadian clock protein KaiB